jgi:hypothetical protein
MRSAVDVRAFVPAMLPHIWLYSRWGLQESKLQLLMCSAVAVRTVAQALLRHSRRGMQESKQRQLGVPDAVTVAAWGAQQQPLNTFTVLRWQCCRTGIELCKGSRV